MEDREVKQNCVCVCATKLCVEDGVCESCVKESV